MASIHIRNPHSVLAALETRPGDVQQIILPGYSKGGGRSAGDAWDQVAKIAEQKRIQIVAGHSHSAGGSRDQKGRRPEPQQQGGRESVAEAVVKERQGIPVEELFANAPQRAGGKGLWLALDSLQDPHNVGAIFRAAAFFGVQGILLTQERSAPLTGTAYDVACGGIEYVPFTQQTNLQRAFEVAKDAGMWILGTSEHAHDELSSIQKDRPWLLVFGNEEKGMRRLTEESCDLVTRVSPIGKVTSLNVSVAAGIFIQQLTSR